MTNQPNRKIVLFPPIDEKRLHVLRESAGDVPVVNCLSDEEAHLEIADATGFYGKITPSLLSASKRLSWVQSPTASLEHYIFPELIEHPCQLSNMRGIFGDVIADHVMGLVLMAARNLHIYVRQQSEGDWLPVGGQSTHSTLFDGPGQEKDIDRAHLHLSDCTLGVVGVGGIGSEICRRAKAFRLNILGVDPVCRLVEEINLPVWPTERLDELLAVSDFVVIAAPHTPATEGLFGPEQFRRMKSSAWLINVGRGVIVQLDALTDALQSGEIGGAALDVLEQEPLPKNHPLWSLRNVIITPHVAAASPKIPERHLEQLAENVRRHCAGEPPLTLVDKSSWF
ncbi:Glycerate dehydrogenase [Thalassoglobus neptunius]|uniref:Glycerate dehydrogenase n=1 Tax=Thalassoglobus neptunius TaxID=1938619 RepID=A0A5C5VRM0_9PLAN|nr:D-2-hydroxyacid dehydrogenase [Thalassoglobus neptunius]TWT40713.1 Glycerate dehydrogenase [Thalassoglobus neptunius]